MNRIAVIGNTNWQNKSKVTRNSANVKRKFGDDLIVVGAGGNEGANSMVRKYALEYIGILVCDMKNINPSFSGRNMYSAMPESYYGKPYHFSVNYITACN
jgi:hypothetical protein